MKLFKMTIYYFRSPNHIIDKNLFTFIMHNLSGIFHQDNTEGVEQFKLSEA